MPGAVDTFESTMASISTLPTASSWFAALQDAELLEIQTRLAEMRRHIDSCAAVSAGEIARRSRRELGYSGLAASAGHRTPQALLAHITHSTKQEAASLVNVGLLLQESQASKDLAAMPDASDAAHVEDHWLGPVAEAVTGGRLNVAGASSIRAGLGAPNADVTARALMHAAERLAEDAGSYDADELFAAARAVRDVLDAEGVADRESARAERRSFRIAKLPDGMIKAVWILDPESGAEILDTYDNLTSPRRGGPRFVDQAEKARSDRIVADSRTTEQMAHDGFLHLVRMGSEVDPGTVLGQRRPAVRVLVKADSLAARSGHGRLEGHGDPVSIATVERMACTAGTIPIQFDDDGRCLNVGRTRRLFTDRQRVALAVRDGGCMWPGCDRPPSWTEAHHINQWHRDSGGTDVDDGVLLCRFHHMLLHNNNWRIRRDGSAYLLVPPRAMDREQRPVLLASRSSALADLLGTRATG